eukprot:TRINITY_DN3965_c0_g2_i1.p1 TRINITY_DN3965_c0_g2~~TRINITY_DN3965_c0_g2_i1.p1  ORF type:complete len:728 (-),score=186.10 TRINITY_DN3965_c0_g2_i1:569-2752(-)
MEEENQQQPTEFFLSGQAFGHSSDVRSICELYDGKIASCSRDGTTRIWAYNEDLHSWEEEAILLGHEETASAMGVRAVYYLENDNKKFLVSAGDDKNLLVWDLDTDITMPSITYVGHTDHITCLSSTVDGVLISGSGDNTVRIWRENETVCLSGHEAPVWGVIGLSDGNIVSCSGDRTIRIWNGSECVNVLTGHDDAVRSLTDVKGVGFLSSSNDGTLKLWTYDGTCISTLIGHESFVYSVAVLPSGEFVSASEDGTVRVWSGNECINVLAHPQGVWCVSSKKNGDILSACQDGVVRIWTRDMERIASDDALEMYAVEIANRETPEAQTGGSIGDLNLNQLAGPEALLKPGTTDGETLMVRESEGAFVYHWEASSRQWKKLGSLENAIEQKDYDLSFDVEIGEGGRTKKLGYNRGENPYVAAQRFIDENEVPQNFLETIAQFVIKNVPEDMKKLPQQEIIQVKKSNSKFYPQQKPALFDNIKSLPAIHKKIISINNDIEEHKLEDAELISLSSIVSKIAETTKYHVSEFYKPEYDLLQSMLLWPKEHIFPAIDLFRILSLHPRAARDLSTPEILNNILDVGLKSDNLPPTFLLTYRLISNLFQFEMVRPKLALFEEKILDSIVDNFENMGETHKTAMASVLLNASIMYLQTKNDSTQCLAAISETLLVDSGNDTKLRLLVALGTLVYDSPNALELASDLGIISTLEGIESDDNRIKQCAADIIALTK